MNKDNYIFNYKYRINNLLIKYLGKAINKYLKLLFN